MFKKPEIIPMLNQEVAYRSDNINLSLVAPNDKIILRGKSSLLSQAVKSATGLAMPKTCQFVSNQNKKKSATNNSQQSFCRMAWVSPDEYLLTLPYGMGEKMLAELSQLLHGKHHALVDVSDYYYSINLSGVAALTLLSKATPLNLNPQHFQIGDVKGTHFGNASILVYYLANTRNANNSMAHVEIQVRSSFLPYLWQYLLVASKEFG